MRLLDLAAAAKEGAALLDDLAGALDQGANYLGWLDSLHVTAVGSFAPYDMLVAAYRKPTGRTLYVVVSWYGPQPEVRVWDVRDPRPLDRATLRHYRDHLAPGAVWEEIEEHKRRWDP